MMTQLLYSIVTCFSIYFFRFLGSIPKKTPRKRMWWCRPMRFGGRRWEGDSEKIIFSSPSLQFLWISNNNVKKHKLLQIGAFFVAFSVFYFTAYFLLDIMRSWIETDLRAGWPAIGGSCWAVKPQTGFWNVPCAAGRMQDSTQPEIHYFR